MREVLWKIQLVWTFEKVCAKKTKSRSVKKFTVHKLFWPDLSFLPRPTQISKWIEIWSRPHASNYLPHKKNWILWIFLVFVLNFFLTGSSWARAPGWIIVNTCLTFVRRAAWIVISIHPSWSLDCPAPWQVVAQHKNTSSWWSPRPSASQ